MDISILLLSQLSDGLSTQEAADRLQECGANALLATDKVPWYMVLLARHFIDVLIAILLIAAAISLALGEVGDAVTILVIVELNGILGFVQEWKAERAIEALQQMLEPHCKVIRKGREQTIDARELVPGDIVVLATGDRVQGTERCPITTAKHKDSCNSKNHRRNTPWSPVKSISII